MVVFKDVKKEDLSILMQNRLYLDKTKSKHEVARYLGFCSAVLFKSGKLLLQGNIDNVNKIKEILVKEGLKLDETEFFKESGVVVGTDECLKGDSFGGIVVAGVKANDSERTYLKLIGVTDSKKLNDSDVKHLAGLIKKKVNYSIKEVMPEEYNKHKMTDLLNVLHEQAMIELEPYDYAITDKYPGARLSSKLETKAEVKYVEVAAASILARDAGLAQLEKLSKDLGFNVPKGSTHVKEAILTLKKSKKDYSRYVKLNFKNVKDYLNL